jgi:hypothetical protein
LAPDVRIQIPGVPIAPGRAPVIEHLIASSESRAPVIEIDHVEIQFLSDTRASARFDAIVSDSQAGDLHGDARRVRAELERGGTEWVISTLSASPEERAQPEARP